MESNPDDVKRQFFAVYLGSKVEKDGQVPGFSAWWDKQDEWQRRQSMRYSEACWTKIERDGRDPDECIASGVSAFREAMSLYIPPQRHRVEPEELDQLVSIMTKNLGWEHA